MILANYDKKDGSMMYLIPMQDESNCDVFADTVTSSTWMYYCDGQPHKNPRIKRTIPTMVVHGSEDIWGGENDIRRAGYRKHWMVFKDTSTGLYYFGNYPSFSKSDDPDDRARAVTMSTINIEILKTL